MAWHTQNFFKYAVGILLVLLIIFVFFQLNFLFTPVLNFIETLFFPILFAGILYYIFRPIVQFLQRSVHSRTAAIMIVYLLVIFFISIIGSFLGPIIVEQINLLTAAPGETIKSVKETTINLMSFLNISELKNILTVYLYKINDFISNNIVEALTSLTHFAVVLILTPFILFYFLKDDRPLYSVFLKIIPNKYRREIKILFDDIDRTLSTFITGQVLVALSMGVLLFLGYLLIGLKNAMILAFFATFFFTIPIVGSLIAVTPALLVGLSESGFMAFKVTMVWLAVLALEGNLISPQIMAQRLHIHPVILMLTLLASGTLYGVLGLFLATPVYALAQVIIIDLYHFYEQRSLKKSRKIRPKSLPKITPE